MRFKREREWPEIGHDEIVRRARILVIDDTDFPYRQLFERDGYTVQKWSDIDDLPALESGQFDLILLDLLGVGTAESSDQGFGVLKHIRKTSPAQIVVAYSNSDLSLEYQPFFRDADAVLHKTADYVEFKRTVDRLLRDRFSLGFYVHRIEQELGEQASNAPKAVDKARRAILTGDVNSLRRYLSKKLEDQVTVDRVIAVVGAGAQVLSLWKT